jgi:hypothetical protein
MARHLPEDMRAQNELELWREVEEWVEDREPSWPFSFENICDVLDLKPDYLRRGLRTCKERVRTSARADAEYGRSREAAGTPEGDFRLSALGVTLPVMRRRGLLLLVHASTPDDWPVIVEN